MDTTLTTKENKMPENSFNLEEYKPIFPMVYLVLATIIVIVCKVFEIPDIVAGGLIGAVLTRIKVPAPNGK